VVARVVELCDVSRWPLPVIAQITCAPHDPGVTRRGFLLANSLYCGDATLSAIPANCVLRYVPNRVCAADRVVGAELLVARFRGRTDFAH
jgi:hypothetical protein